MNRLVFPSKTAKAGAMLAKSFGFGLRTVDVWELAKSESPKEGAAPSAMRIGGLVSTDSMDRQGERVLQKGLDFTEFLEHGYFIDDHKTGTVLGYPTSVRFLEKGMRQPNGLQAQKSGWYVEGYMLDTPRAREVFQLAKALQPTPRRLGFSVEGSVTDQQGGVVRKAIVRNVAITTQPVNTDTRLELLAKSLAVGPDGELGGESGSGTGAALRQESLEDSATNVADANGGSMKNIKDLVAEQDAVGQSVQGAAGRGAPGANGEAAGLAGQAEVDGDKLLKSLIGQQDKVLGQAHEDTVALAQMSLVQSKLIKSLVDKNEALESSLSDLHVKMDKLLGQPVGTRGATSPDMAKSLAERQRAFSNGDAGNGGGAGGGKPMRVQCQEALDAKLSKAMQVGDNNALTELTRYQATIESNGSKPELLARINAISILG